MTDLHQTTTITPPGSPHYEQAVAAARKIEVMAHKPVDELVRQMRLMGFSPEHQRIVLETMARRALTAQSR